MINSTLEFPISGPLKIFVLTMEWLIIFLFFEFALLFLAKYRFRKNRIKNLQDRAYFWLFFGYSIMWIFIIIRDYYVYNPYRKIIIENIREKKFMISFDLIITALQDPDNSVESEIINSLEFE